MKEYFEMLKQRVDDNPSNYGDADSVLGLLYECFNENNLGSINIGPLNSFIIVIIFFDCNVFGEKRQ